jgi:anthranilate phosphoribosyltransferase
LGENTVVEFHHPCALAASSLFPENFPIQSAALSDLAGGDCHRNAEIVRRVLGGEERGPKRDAVLLNAAAALFVAEKSRSLADGWERAAQVIDSGKALAKLKELIASH